jgi:DNA-directed RNA polymerase specialized sigma24 family protein
VKLRASRAPGKVASGAGKLCMSSAELDDFYRKVTLPLLRRARWRHGLSRDDAWDIVQDAFLIAIERIDSAKNPTAWIIQVVDHLALNHNRKLLRRIRLQARWSVPPDGLGRTRAGPGSDEVDDE